MGRVSGPISKIGATRRKGIRLPFHGRSKCLLRKECMGYSRRECRGLFIGCNDFMPKSPIRLERVWATNDGSVQFTDSQIGIWARNGYRVDIVVSIHEDDA